MKLIREIYRLFINVKQKTYQVFCVAIVSLAALFCMNATTFAGTIYVDGSLTPCGDGIGWPTAYRYLQDALALAGTGDQIWVREGIYFVDQRCSDPVGTGDRTKTFQLVKGVLLRGGFAGGEAFAFQRDPLNNITVLSGLVDDGPPVDMCPDGIPFAQCGTGGDCYETGGIGCNNSFCCQLVCDVDPWCCCNAWDQIWGRRRCQTPSVSAKRMNERVSKAQAMSHH